MDSSPKRTRSKSASFAAIAEGIALAGAVAMGCEPVFEPPVAEGSAVPPARSPARADDTRAADAMAPTPPPPPGPAPELVAPAPQADAGAAVVPLDPDADGFEEDFETGLSRWTILQGEWSIVTEHSSILTSAVGVNEARAYAGGTSWADLAVSGRLRVNAIGEGRRVYLAARFSDANNWYGAAFYNSGTRKVQLRKKIDGTSSDIASTNFAFAEGRWYDVTVVVVGAQLTMWVDGVPVLAAADSDLAQGRVALLADESSVSWDDIRVAVGPDATGPEGSMQADAGALP